MAIEVRTLADTDRPWLRRIIEQEWGVPVVTPVGAYHEPEVHEGVVAEVEGARAGAATYVRRGDEWEIVTVVATAEGVGVGRAMLERVRQLAGSSGATRAWLITTDTGPITFYEGLGMTRARTHRSFVEVVRHWKPSVGGFQDALEMEWRFDRS